MNEKNERQEKKDNVSREVRKIIRKWLKKGREVRKIIIKWSKISARRQHQVKKGGKSHVR